MWGAWQRARNKFLLPRETRQIYLGKRLGSPVTCWMWAKYYWKGPGRKEKLQALHWLSLLERSDLFVCDLRCYYICEYVCVCGGGMNWVGEGHILFFQEQHFTRREFIWVFGYLQMLGSARISLRHCKQFRPCISLASQSTMVLWCWLKTPAATEDYMLFIIMYVFLISYILPNRVLQSKDSSVAI